MIPTGKTAHRQVQSVRLSRYACYLIVQNTDPSKEVVVGGYIYQRKNWTNFTWENKVINVVIGEVRHLQGKKAGQMSSLGFSIQEETN